MADSLLQAQKYSDYPFEELVNDLNLERDLSRHPLFDTMFAMQNMDTMNPVLPDLLTWEQESTNTKFDMTWAAVEGETLQLTVEYSTDLFRRDTVKRMLDQYLHLLERIVSDPDLSISQLELITPSEKAQVWKWVEGESVEPPGQRIIELFERQAGRIPEKKALITADRSMTYRELNETADRWLTCLAAGGCG